MIIQDPLVNDQGIVGLSENLPVNEAEQVFAKIIQNYCTRHLALCSLICNRITLHPKV